MRFFRDFQIFFGVLGVCILVAGCWSGYQWYRYCREQNAKAVLVQIQGSSNSTSAYGSDDFSTDQLEHGGLYSPQLYVQLADSHIDQSRWNALCEFRYLRTLSIHDCTFAPGLNVDFTVFPDLWKIEIDSSELPASGWSTLAQSKSLRTARFSRNVAMDTWMPQIGQLQQLRSLQLAGEISDQSLAHLSKLTQLEDLAPSAPLTTPAAIAAIVSFRNLKSLHVSGSEISDEGLAKLAAGLPQLEELELAYCERVSDRGIQHLVALKELQILNLDYTPITGASGTSIAQLTKLKQLHLRDTKFDNQGFRAITGLQQLVALDLGETLVSHPSFSGAFPELEELRLRNVELNDHDITSIATLPKLWGVVISGEGITNASIKSLVNSSSLRVVVPMDTKIDEEGPEWVQFQEMLEERVIKDPENQPTRRFPLPDDDYDGTFEYSRSILGF